MTTLVKSQIRSGYSIRLMFGAVLTLGGCYYLLSQPERLRTDAVAQLESDHIVRVRHASDIAWTTTQSTPLFDGSLVEVPLDGKTSVSLKKGFHEDLEPGSIVRITSSGHGDVRKEVLLQRDRHSGNVAYRKTTDLGSAIGLDVSQVNLLTPFSAVDQDAVRQRHLGHSLRKTYDHVLSMDYVQSNVHYPRLRVFGAFDDYSVKPAYPPIGALYKAQQNDSLCIAFVWSPVPVAGVSYVVEISKTWNFDYFRTFSAEKNYVRLKVNQASDYFWRVRAVQGAENFLGDTARFSVYKPPLPAEEIRRLSIIRRIRETNAFLMDLEYCN